MPPKCKLLFHDLCDQQCETPSPEEWRRRAYVVVCWTNWGHNERPHKVAAVGPLAEELLWMAVARVGPLADHYQESGGGLMDSRLRVGGFTSGRKCSCQSAENMCDECVTISENSRGWIVYNAGDYFGRGGDWFGGASVAVL
jgi:hypothetical protein